MMTHLMDAAMKESGILIQIYFGFSFTSPVLGQLSSTDSRNLMSHCLFLCLFSGLP